MDKALLKQVYDRFGPPLNNPNVSYSVSGTGNATYRYVITAFNETGETDGTLIVVSNAPENLSSVQYIKLTWKEVDRAKGYRVYGRAEGYFGLLTELDMDQTEFIDYGVLVPDLLRKPPQTNQTGRLNWEKVVFLPGRFAQSAEMNELQSILNAKLKSIGDAVFDDGDVIRGCSLTVDKETGEAKITEGLVYIDGAVRYVKGGSLVLPTTGTVYVGINVIRSYIDETDDPFLKDPAQGYPGYATAGAAREVIDFEWVYSENKDSIDVVMWKVVNGVPVQIKPASQMSDVERVVGRKLYDLHGNVLIYGFKARIFKHDTRRDRVVFEIEQGKAYVNGREIEKPQVRFEVSIAQDKSNPVLEEVSVWQGYLYQPDIIPVANVDQVVMRVKVGETRYVPNVFDACNWYYDNVGVGIDSIIGVWTNSSKTTSYTFSNNDLGCTGRNVDVVLSGTGFALNPTKFTPGQSYYIEYLKYVTATKGVRQRAYQEDEFVYQSGVSEYQLSKSDVIKSSRSPIVVIDLDTGHQFIEGEDYTVDLGRSSTTIGPAKIHWLITLPDEKKFKVTYYYWDHVVEGDYVAVDSYVSDLSSYDYDEIEYPNVIDFRANGVKPASEKPNILVQYRGYLSKWGWLMLNEDGEFDFVYGASMINSVRPKRPDGGLPLYAVYFPAASQDLILSVEVSYMVKRDYDVNTIESRVERMEHDLGLTMAELQLLTKETLAPKKALLVDSFIDVGMMDTTRSTVNIDSSRGVCFIRKNLQVGSLSIDNMSNVSITSKYLTLPWREGIFDQQLVWTEDYAVEVNPFSVFTSYVYVEPHPANDYWVETRESTVVVETEDRGVLFGSGIDPNTRYLMNWGRGVVDLIELARRGMVFDVAWGIGARFVVREIRTTQEIGVVVRDVEVIPYLRQRVVLLWIKGCLPGQDNIKAKFDGKVVSLSVATPSDLNSVGLVGVTPRGSVGSQPGSVKADSNGEVIAKFIIPSGVRAGRRLIEVYTDDNLVYGSAEYFGQGMLRHLERLVREIRLRRADLIPRPPADPIAQSFYVEKPVVLTSAWIWVHRVPPAGIDYGLEVGIRELTESGLPGSRVLGRGSVSKSQIMSMMGISSEQQVVTTPTFGNAVKVQFDDPIYLSPGWYCLYVACPANGYYVFTAKGRKKVLGNLANPTWNKIGYALDRQVHDGVFFMSYNGVTWEVDMERDLMFRLNKAVFDTSKVGTVELGVSGIDYPIHEFQYGTAVIVPPGTVVDSEYNIGNGWTAFKMVDFEQEKKQEGYGVVNVGAEANNLRIRLSLRTQDSDVAPFVMRDFSFIQVWRYDSSSDYYTNEVDVGQQFMYFKMWINERLNNGVVNYMVSFDGGVHWYDLPLVNTVQLREGWVEKELGGSLSSITGGVLTNASRFIVRINLSVGAMVKWLSPELSALRVLVY
jgi:hypothetical protein